MGVMGPDLAGAMEEAVTGKSQVCCEFSSLTLFVAQPKSIGPVSSLYNLKFMSRPMGPARDEL